MIKKPHKGTIDDWYKVEISSSYPGLGYFIKGLSIDHPAFYGLHIHTSYVVKHEGDEIETRNSRYTLGDELGRE